MSYRYHRLLIFQHSLDRREIFFCCATIAKTVQFSLIDSFYSLVDLTSRPSSANLHDELRFVFFNWRNKFFLLPRRTLKINHDRSRTCLERNCKLEQRRKETKLKLCSEQRKTPRAKSDASVERSKVCCLVCSYSTAPHIFAINNPNSTLHAMKFSMIISSDHICPTGVALIKAA